MAFSVETLVGLERKILVSVPADIIAEKVSERLKKLATTAKISGFRPGKVPMNLLKQRYSENLYHEVANEMIKSSLFESLQAAELVPVNQPMVDVQPYKIGDDFCYSATFEILPIVDIKLFTQDEDEIEIVSAEVTEQDVDTLLEQLREREKTWVEVARPAELGDKLHIDYAGFIIEDNKPFDNNSAHNYELVLGAGNMIAGFEEGLVGTTVGQTLSLQLCFPENYHAADLSNKPVRFDITVHKIEVGELPELNKEFAQKFNLTDPSMDSLRADLKDSMTRELERKVSTRNRSNIFAAFRQKNPLTIPKSLVENEIEDLKHNLYHQLFGHEHHVNEKIPDFPRHLFEKDATHRVHLSLLFSAYVDKYAVKADQARVEAMIERLSQSYEHPAEFIRHCHNNKDRMDTMEGSVLEEMVSEQLMQNARLSLKKVTYQEIMHQQSADHDTVGE